MHTSPPLFSLRTAYDPSPSLLHQAVERRREAGAPVLDLTMANPTQAKLPYPPETLDALRVSSAVYKPHPFGCPVARAAVAAEFPSCVVEQVILTASTSESYSFLLKLLCDPGDEVLIPQPSYPLLDTLTQFEGVRGVPYPLAYDGQWHLDAAGLRAAISPRTRAILVVHPNMPTGSFLTREEFAVLQSTGLPLVVDEVFAAYPWTQDPRRVRTVLDTEGRLLFSLGGLSKYAGLPQRKVGWIAVGGEAPLVHKALERLELLADTFLSVSTPAQQALPLWLVHSRVTRGAIQERLRRNLETLHAAVAGSPLTLRAGDGGWYAMLQLPSFWSDEPWALALLESGVLVHPGCAFPGVPWTACVMSLLTPEAVFREGVQRIRNRVVDACR